MRQLLALVGILGGVIPTAAQTSQTPPFQEIIVVTASLEEEEKRELPSSVEVIDHEEIEARQSTTVADLVATATGATVMRSGAPGQVTSLFIRGTESDHTLVLWNGVELNNPFFAGFNWAFIPSDGVERVEVERWPFSSLYGGDALGGVVQIISSSEDGARVRLEAGEDGYGRIAVTGGRRLGNGRFDVAGHLRRSDGRFDNEFFDGEELVTRGEWRIARGRSLGFVVRAADAETGIPFTGGLPSPRRRISWRERQLAVPFRAEIGDWRVRAQLSRVTYDSAFRDPEDAFGFTAADTESEALRARSVASYRRSSGSWVAFGAEWERLEVDDRSVFGVNLEGESQRTSAFFAELRRALGPVALELGLRYDDNSAFGSQTSPRLGLLVALGEGIRFRASYGEAFRAPSIGELFFPFSGNPDLEPETSESFELGVEQTLGRWRWGIVAFENRL
ncbi:MAG: TonB-dependent receptor, partial [Thermoanaerobaculia bacterium]